MERTMIEQLSLTAFLASALGEVTEQQMEYEGSKLDDSAKGEQKLGMVSSDLIKRLYCAGKALTMKARSMEAQAECATDANAEASLKADAAQTEQLGKIIGNIMWYEVRSEVSEWGPSIGLRKGWAVVKGSQDNTDPIKMIRKLLGGE